MYQDIRNKIICIKKDCTNQSTKISKSYGPICSECFDNMKIQQKNDIDFDISEFLDRSKYGNDKTVNLNKIFK